MARSVNGTQLASWQRRLNQYESSGLTVAAFCQQQTLSPAQFYYWRRRVRQGSHAAADCQPAVTGRRGAAIPSGPVVEVLLGGGDILLRIPADDRELIDSVLARLCPGALPQPAFQRLKLDSAVSVAR